MESLIYLTVIRILSPIFVALSIWFFFRGHDLPGGGFIAGLILGVVFILNLINYKQKETLERWIEFRTLIGIGLLRML